LVSRHAPPNAKIFPARPRITSLSTNLAAKLAIKHKGDFPTHSMSLPELKNFTLVFWQPIISPHMIYFAHALKKHCKEVYYLTYGFEDDSRENQGWEVDQDILNNLKIFNAKKDFSLKTHELFNESTIHLTNGISKKYLPERFGEHIKSSKALWICMIERVKFNIINYIPKTLKFKILFSPFYSHQPDYFFAIGEGTKNSLLNLSIPANRIIDFTYFIKDFQVDYHQNKVFTILFIGHLSKRKNVISLLKALNQLTNESFLLKIYGDGPEKNNLIEFAENSTSLRSKFIFNPAVKMSQIPSILQTGDLLVLPSSHDGWGVVVTEALLAGKPVIVSDQCGSSTAVKFSKTGGIYSKQIELIRLLRQQIQQGPITKEESTKIKHYAKKFTDHSGANYFKNIFDFIYQNRKDLPLPPWEVSDL
jgi:glycosyltransferase involved in cell wall biosynthesis